MDIITKMKKKVKVFYDRKKELSEFSEYQKDLKKDAPKHLLIVAPRRMGKTHLIQKYLLNNIDEKVVPIYLDLLFLESTRKLSENMYDQFVENYAIIHNKKFFKYLSLLKGNMGDLVDAIKEVGVEFGRQNGDYISLRFNLKKDVDEISLFIKTLDVIEEIAKKKNLKVILALDEFQRITEWQKWKEFAAALRSNMQYSENIQLIISGSKSTFIKENIIAKTKPFWKQLISYELKPFSKEAILEILEKNKLNRDFAENIERDTDNIPDYVIKTTNLLNNYKTYDDALIKLIDQEKYFFESTYENLNKKERLVLKTLTNEIKTFGEIEAEVNKPAYAIKKLLKEDIIILKGAKYNISDPIFKKILANPNL